MVKDLVPIDPHKQTSVREIDLMQMPCVRANTPLYDMLNEFISHQHSKGDMALVANEDDSEFLGIITLQDVFDQLVKEEQFEEDIEARSPSSGGKSKQMVDMLRRVSISLERTGISPRSSFDKTRNRSPSFERRRIFDNGAGVGYDEDEET